MRRAIGRVADGEGRPDMVRTALRAAALGSSVEARRDLRIMISVATHNDPSTVPIIVRSNAPELSNNIIQKALAFGRQQSGSVVNSER
jgi:hypothetical protein